MQRITELYQLVQEQLKETTQRDFDDLTDEKTYNFHSNFVKSIGDLLLKRESKSFEVDEHNKNVLRFLTYYFNNCKLAENVFPGEEYKLHKPLLICGQVGTGKTKLMQVFSEYLKRTKNPNFFHDVSVTQMINYYKIHNHLDKYTYNEEGSIRFEGNPMNICLNDIGTDTHLHFGTDTKILITDFVYARYEIWTQQGKKAHLTTNLSVKDLKTFFTDTHGRVIDRFKSYNVIPLTGASRR